MIKGPSLEWLESSSARRAGGAGGCETGCDRLYMTWPCVLAAHRAKHSLVCTQRSVGSGGEREGRDSAPLCNPHLQSCLQRWGPSTGGNGAAGTSPEEGTEMLTGMKNLCSGDRERELGMFHLEELQGDLRAPSSTSRGSQERWEPSFQQGLSGWDKGQRFSTAGSSIHIRYKEEGFYNEGGEIGVEVCMPHPWKH